MRAALKLGKFFEILFLLLIFLFFPNKILASAPTIISYPTDTLTLDTSFNVTATMSGLSKNAIYRLRLALAPTGTSNYFGSTYNGTGWYNGTPPPINYSSFLSITTDNNGVWNGDIQGRIDSDDPNFTTGSGSYDLKIGRYTETGSTATWSNIVTVNITVPPTPTPTDTPTPTPNPTNTPTPLPTSKSPTNTPIPTATKIPTRNPTKVDLKPNTAATKSSTATDSPSVTIDNNLWKGEVLGTSVKKTNKNSTKNVNNSANVIYIFIGVFILLLSCGILGFQLWKKGKINLKKFW